MLAFFGRVSARLAGIPIIGSVWPYLVAIVATLGTALYIGFKLIAVGKDLEKGKAAREAVRQVAAKKKIEVDLASKPREEKLKRAKRWSE